MEARHDSVLMQEVLDALEVQSDDTVVDATLGGAGHFREFLSRLSSDGTIIGIDADQEAVERARTAYAEDRRTDRPVTHLVNDNFRNLERILERLDVGAVNKILFDLGWSGYQVASARGFSFQSDAPLYMSYGEGGTTAADILNTAPEAELADLIFTYGEERFARGIARAIVQARAKERMLTTGQLVDAVKAGTPRWYHNGKTHPATKTFQALRIATNDEIGAIEDGLGAALGMLAPEGRLAVISFHSIEDRVVKRLLQAAVADELGTLEPKKPIVPSKSELAQNRRARSAKLRVFVRAARSTDAAGSETADSHLAYA